MDHLGMFGEGTAWMREAEDNRSQVFGTTPFTMSGRNLFTSVIRRNDSSLGGSGGALMRVPRDGSVSRTRFGPGAQAEAFLGAEGMA